MEVANAMYVAARIQQGLYNFLMPVSRGPMQRIGVVSSFTRVWICAVPEQQLDNFQLPALGSSVQTGPAGVLFLRIACTRQA
jgi:hypothetical protein